jgi:predicted ATPase/DNA-binding NarL/FixJ family response regulator
MTRAGDVLLGRERELELLENLLNAARDGDPGFVVVSGEAGIGKTRLLHEVSESAASRGCLTLEGRAAEFERELPFGVLTDALDAYLRSLDARALERLAMDRLGALAAVFPSLGELAEAVDYPISALERFRVYQAVCELVERLAARSPLVLVLDDLQWADGASLELISYLLRRPPQAAVMLAMAVRTGQGEPAVVKSIGDIQRSSAVDTIEVGPLSEVSIRRLVGDVEGVDIELLQHESGGNPFFAVQLARASRSEADAMAVGGLGVPPAVARAIAAELEELSQAARTLAEAAAVVGDPFELDLAAAAMDRPENEVWERVDELVAKDLVRGTDVPRRFRFRHPLVRHAVYGSCSPSVRMACHRRAVDVLATRGAAASVMAGHVEQSARHGDAFAIEILRQAGEEASSRAPKSAASWFTAALRLLPANAPANDRVDLLMSLAAAEAAIGRFSAAHAALDECVALTSDEDVELRVGLVVATAEIEQLLGHHKDARARLQRAHEELTDRASPARVSLLIALSTNSLYLADHRGMLEWGRRALEAADEVGDVTLSAAALAAYTMGATFAGQVDFALEQHVRAASLVDSLADDELLSRLDALSNLATAELYLDLHAFTCRHGERGLSLARSTGRTQLLPILIPILGCSLWMTGELRRSAEVLDEAIEGARLVDNAQGLSLALFNRALSAVMAGDLEIALEMGAESVELAHAVDNGVITAFAGAIHAQALCEAGEPKRAVELLLDSVGGEDIPLLAGSWRATYFELLTRCCLELGQIENARAAAEKVRAQADEQGLQLSGLMADRAGAAVALAEGRAEDATDLALSAVGRSEEIGARVHAATSRALAGRALSASGRSEETIGQLVRAADDFDALGALRYRDQVEALLRTLGKTIHRRTRGGKRDGSGVELLTGREVEVAELVRAHRTNREIAGELFLSLKTVEAHMRNIFQKLGVSSRAEVAELLARTEPVDART